MDLLLLLLCSPSAHQPIQWQSWMDFKFLIAELKEQNLSFAARTELKQTLFQRFSLPLFL